MSETELDHEVETMYKKGTMGRIWFNMRQKGSDGYRNLP